MEIVGRNVSTPWKCDSSEGTVWFEQRTFVQNLPQVLDLGLSQTRPRVLVLFFPRLRFSIKNRKSWI